jgi:hypothetical protein
MNIMPDEAGSWKDVANASEGGIFSSLKRSVCDQEAFLRQKVDLKSS